jgi:hypothetical protein
MIEGEAAHREHQEKTEKEEPDVDVKPPDQKLELSHICHVHPLIL